MTKPSGPMNAKVSQLVNLVRSLGTPVTPDGQGKRSGGLSFYMAVALTAMALVTGLLATVGAVVYLQGTLDQAAKVQFDQRVARIKAEISLKFEQPMAGLAGLRSSYASKLASLDATLLTQAEFEAALSVRDLPREFPGVRSFTFLERVQRADLGAFVQRMQSQWGPDFAVRSSGAAPDLLVVSKVAPLVPNHLVVGFDAGQDPVRREAAQRAMASGQATVSGPINLLLGKNRTQGFLVFLPVYREGAAPVLADGRAATVLGLLVSPVAITKLFFDAGEASNSKLNFSVFDGSRLEQDTLVYDDTVQRAASTAQSTTASLNTAAVFVPKFTVDEALNVGGRLFTLRIDSTPEFESAQDRSSLAVTALGGAAISFLLALSVWLLAAGRLRAQNLAGRMTVELDQLAKVVRHTDSVVVLTDTHGQITWVNDGYTRLTGRTVDDVKGTTALALILQDRTPPETLQRLTQHARRGEAFRGEVVVRGADLQDRWLDLELQPNLDAMGQSAGFMQIGTDITAQKRAQQRLEAAMRDAKALLSTFEMHAIVSVADCSGNIIDVNPAFCEISGYAREELLGHNHRMVSSGTHPPEFWAAMWADIATGKSWRADVCNRKKNGELYWVDNIVTPFLGEYGLVERYVSVRNDITARKSAELALAASEAFLVRAGRIAGVGGWRVDLVKGKIEWSKVTRQIHDVAEDFEPDLATAINFYAPEARPVIERAVEIGMREGKGWDLELPFITAIGRQIWVRAVGEVEFENGKPVALVGAFQDITERRTRDQELHLLEACVSRINDSILITKANFSNANGPEIVFANPAFEVLTGFSTAEVIGKTPRIFQGVDTDRAELARIKAALMRGESLRTELLNYSKTGQPYWIEIDISPVRSATQEITHFVAVERDVTERRQHSAALREAVTRAEQATESKGQFLATMSHEIRTPMNAIIGMLTLLHRTNLSPQQLDYAEKSQNAALSLLGLINDILDFSKAEAGKMTLDPQPFTVSKLMRDLAVILSTSVGAKDIDVLYDIDSAIPPVLLGDAMRLQQVLINLGGNAVKFTAQGQVVVSLRLQDVAQGLARIDFSVKDSGIGIAPQNQSRIFAGFSQAEASTTRKFGGTGLGLAICKRLIELMGGQLVLTSALGQGSMFSFSLVLPVVTSVPQELALAPRLSVPVQRVLVIDDNPLACELAARMVRAWNWPCECVHSGEQALALIGERTVGAAFAFDVIYVDCQLPGMDGWETAKRIRALSAAQGTNGAQDEHGAQNVAIIMVSGNSRDSLSMRTEAEQAMLNGFLVKPFTASGLLEAALPSGVRQVGIRKGNRPPASQRRLSGMRILVVEDNQINQQVAEELLNCEGAVVSLAANGQLGVDAVRFANPQFDVVLMDLQMPVMDGFTATRTIREQLGLRALPVIAMTANAMDSDRDDCLSAGMNAHVGKPFNLNVLVKTLLNHCDPGVKNQAQACEGSAVEPTPAPAASLPGQPSDIDLAGALERLSGMASLYLRAAKEFVKVIPTVMEEFMPLLHADSKRATMQMHSLKGNAAMLGATALTELTGQLEKMCKSGSTVDEISVQLPHLERTLHATLMDLQAVIGQLEQGAQPAALVRAPVSVAVPEPGAILNPDGPGAAIALKAQLQALAGLLANSDLAALTLFAQVRGTIAPDLQSQVDSLADSLENLDLESAHAQCLALIGALATT